MGSWVPPFSSIVQPWAGASSPLSLSLLTCKLEDNPTRRVALVLKEMSIRCLPQKKQGLALTSATGALRVLPTSPVHISSSQGYAASAAGFTCIHDDIYTSRGTRLELRNKSQGSRGRLCTDSLSKASRGNLCSVCVPTEPQMHRQPSLTSPTPSTSSSTHHPRPPSPRFQHSKLQRLTLSLLMI